MIKYSFLQTRFQIFRLEHVPCKNRLINFIDTINKRITRINTFFSSFQSDGSEGSVGNLMTSDQLTYTWHNVNVYTTKNTPTGSNFFKRRRRRNNTGEKHILKNGRLKFFE